MKIAAAEALAKLAREDVPDEVDRAYSGRRLRYGPEYIMPVPFDPRLISAVSPAVAQAAMDTGVARRPIADMRSYTRALSGRLDPTATGCRACSTRCRPIRSASCSPRARRSTPSAPPWRSATPATARRS